MVAGAWLAGPTAWAVAVRRALAPYMREPALVYGVVAVLVAVVLFWWAPTPATRNPATALVLVALLVLGVEALRRRTLREFPDAERGAGVRAWPGAVMRQASRFSAATRPAEELRLEQLERLGQLRTAGVLDDEELRAEKARVLGDENGGKGPGPVAMPAPATDR
jgi:hypothetical protein